MECRKYRTEWMRFLQLPCPGMIVEPESRVWMKCYNFWSFTEANSVSTISLYSITSAA
jgi:hypothetical protein